MLYCITRNEMKFGDIVVPARTRCRIIYISDTNTVDAPGVQVTAYVNLFQLGKKDVKNENIRNTYESRASMTGIVIHTNTKAVYVNADSERYWYKKLYKWEVEKIFPEGIPDCIIEEEYGKPTYPLQSVVEYLEEQFAKWVKQNCEFKEVTEEDIENGECHEDCEPGDRILSQTGIEQFEAKKLEMQNLLERATGFTYDFKGGLIWD